MYCNCGDKDCPICGGDSRVLGTSQRGEDEYWQECMNCGSHTDKYSLKQRAEREWEKGNIRRGIDTSD